MPIRWRTKKSPVMIEESFPFPYEEIRLKIYASPQAWKMLHFYSGADPQKVGEILSKYFTTPVYSLIVSKKGKGFHRGDEWFIDKVKILSALFYSRLKKRLRKSGKTWPKELKKIAKEYESQYQLSDSGRRRAKITTLKMTAFTMEKYYGKERIKHGLKRWTDDPESFRNTYIVRNKFMDWFKANPKYSPRFWNEETILTSKDPAEFVSLVNALKR